MPKSPEQYKPSRGTVEKKYTEPFASIEQAQEIMKGEQFIGPEAIKKTFGFSPDVPEIPFSAEELRHAEILNQKLILYVDKQDNEPLTLEVMRSILDNKTSTGDPFIRSTSGISKRETPRLGWRLTTPDTIDNSKNKTYLEQTEVLIDYLKNIVFNGKTLPKKYQKAINAFEQKKDDIAALDWQEAGPKLAKLAINQYTRENAAEVIYRLAITERQYDVHELGEEYTWTNSVATGGRIVGVGPFVPHGFCAARWESGYSDDEFGVCFSRSV